MKKYIFFWLLATVLIGYQGQMAKADTENYGSLPGLAQQKSIPAQNEQTKESDSMDLQPVPTAQLHSAMLGLESFRVFGYHFKIQKDREMLQSLKEPTFEYITKKIDPHLKLKKIKYDPKSEIYIASCLYLKAYLFWIHNDADSARKTIAVLNRTFPQRHQDITIYHFDKGNISLDSALDDLEDLIGPDPNKKS